MDVFTTRKPTGKPSWPLILIAGVEKSGKSYAGAEMSASPLIGSTFWIEIGEGAADYYGALPGADYDIVAHDGSYRGILKATQQATQQPTTNGLPNALIIDSGTEMWDLLCDEQQLIANGRRTGKDGMDSPITMDQWNAAKKRWRVWLDVLRTHPGPVLITARFEEVTVMKAGKPTTDKTWKVRAEKNLPFEVDAVIELREKRKYELTGIRSLAPDLQIPEGERLHIPSFTFDKFFRAMGLEGHAQTERAYTAPNPTAGASDQLDKARVDTLTAALQAGRDGIRAYCEAKSLNLEAVAERYLGMHGVTIRRETNPGGLTAFLTVLQDPNLDAETGQKLPAFMQTGEAP